jgi:hypothetical protein
MGQWDKGCLPNSKPATTEIQWVNEKLQPGAGSVRNICTMHDTYECRPVTDTKTVVDKVG